MRSVLNTFLLFFLSLLSCSLATGLISQSGKPPARTGTQPRSAKFDDISKRANEAWQASQWEDAIKLYRQALDIRPAWSEGWGYLASALYQSERYGEARDAYRETTILTPDNAPSWAYLGLCEYELRDYQRAFSDLTKAEDVGLGKDNDLIAQVKYHRAILWDTAGQFEKGLGEMFFFPQHNLGSPEIIQAMGLSVLRIPLFPYEIPEEKQEMIILAGEASYAANSQHMDIARKIYEELATKYPNVPNVHFAYGQFLSHVDLDGALREYQKEIELNPSHAYARVEAGYLNLKRGDLDKALAEAKAAAKLLPYNPAAHNLIGRIYMQMDRASDAIPELELATKYNPADSSYHLILARAYQKAGEKTLAEKEIARFNELEKKRQEQQAAATPPQ